MISFYSCLLKYTCSQGHRRVRVCCFQHGSGESRSVSLPPSARAQDSSYRASRSPSQNENPCSRQQSEDTWHVDDTNNKTSHGRHRGRHRPQDREMFLNPQQADRKTPTHAPPPAPQSSPPACPATRSSQDHRPPRRPTNENRLLSATALSCYIFLMVSPAIVHGK